MESTELYTLKAFLLKLQNKTVPEISEACAAKVRSLENIKTPDHNLSENLKAVVLLIRHLRKPYDLKDPDIINYLTEFFTEVEKHDRRAKHVLSELRK